MGDWMSEWFTICTDGTVLEGNHGEPTLKEKQEAVGGYLVSIRLPSGNIMWVNDNGPNRDFPFNRAATALLWDADMRKIGTRLLGNVVMEYTAKETIDAEVHAHIMQYDETVDINDARGLEEE